MILPASLCSKQVLLKAAATVTRGRPPTWPTGYFAYYHNSGYTRCDDAQIAVPVVIRVGADAYHQRRPEHVRRRGVIRSRDGHDTIRDP